MVHPYSEQITYHFLVSQNLHWLYRKLNYLDFILLWRSYNSENVIKFSIAPGESYSSCSSHPSLHSFTIIFFCSAVFKTSRADMDWYLERSGSNVENVMDECCIRLRGLPYGCTKDDITQFFDGIVSFLPLFCEFTNDPFRGGLNLVAW